MPATMPAKTHVSIVDRVWEYASETGQESRDVYVQLLTLINVDNPEAVAAAFAELRATR